MLVFMSRSLPDEPHPGGSFYDALCLPGQRSTPRPVSKRAMVARSGHAFPARMLTSVTLPMPESRATERMLRPSMAILTLSTNCRAVSPRGSDDGRSGHGALASSAGVARCGRPMPQAYGPVARESDRRGRIYSSA